jgi:tetratricopeptide (TPR) repeat protein
MHSTVSHQDYRQQDNASALLNAHEAYMSKEYPKALNWLNRCHLNIMSPAMHVQHNILKQKALIEQNNVLMRQAAQETQNDMPFEALSLLEHCDLRVMLEPTKTIYDGHKHVLLEKINIKINALIQDATHDVSTRGNYSRAFDAIKRCNPDLMSTQTRDAFYSLQARCLLHFRQPQQALKALKQLHDISSEQSTYLFLTCYRALGDAQNLIKTLTSIENWHTQKRILGILNEFVSYLQDKKDPLTAATVLMSFPNWASNESTLMQVAGLYIEAAKALPKTCMQHMTLLQFSLDTYMRIPDFRTRQDVLSKLAPLHFMMGDYVNTLGAYLALNIQPNDPQHHARARCIQALQAFSFVIHAQAPIMRQEHHIVLSYALELQKTGYIKQALDFFLAVPNNFKSMEVRRAQANCQEQLGIYQASVMPLSNFKLPPSVEAVEQASAQHEETCYNAEQSYQGAQYNG